MITDPLFYMVAAPAVTLAGVSKGGFGGGLAFAGLLLIAMIIPPTQAAAIMLPLLCLMDLVGAWVYRREWSRPNMAVLVPGALVGIAVGALTFRYLDDQTLRLVVGTLAVGFPLDHWLRGRRRRAPKVQSRRMGVFWGAIAGLTSFVIHLGGPATNIYLLPQRMEKRQLVATIVIFYAIVNYAKLLPYWWIGLLSPTNVTTALVLAPLAAIGTVIGARLTGWLSEAWVYRISYAMMFGSGLKLLHDGLAPLFA